MKAIDQSIIVRLAASVLSEFLVVGVNGLLKKRAKKAKKDKKKAKKKKK